MIEPTELEELIDGLADLPYGGEAVDQRTHALQTAWHARHARADDEVVLAAALHDVGRAAQVRAGYPGTPHEHAGYLWASTHLTPRVAHIIAGHVPAKRYLVATDPHYTELLSPASVATLRVQGGPMSPEEIAAFRSRPHHREAVQVRRWDDAAKDPAGPLLPIEHLLATLSQPPRIDSQKSHWQHR